MFKGAKLGRELGAAAAKVAGAKVGLRVGRMVGGKAGQTVGKKIGMEEANKACYTIGRMRVPALVAKFAFMTSILAAMIAASMAAPEAISANLATRAGTLILPIV